jgi:hypothetical protein
MNDVDFIKHEFENIKDLKLNIENIFDRIDKKITSLKDIYYVYVKKNTNPDIVLTLDSFHFQTKFIELEYNNYIKIFDLFINRLYADYYKFYKYIYTNLSTYIDSSKMLKFTNHSDFPAYKDLDNKVYDFNIIVNIHLTILDIVNELSSFLISQQHETKGEEQILLAGINIHNFVSIHKFNNTILAEKIKLIIDCLKSYSIFQSKYLERFNLKLKFMYAQMSADIKLESNEIVEKDIDKNILNNVEPYVKLQIKKILNENKTPSISSSDTTENPKMNISDIQDIQDIPIYSNNSTYESFRESNEEETQEEIIKTVKNRPSCKLLIKKIFWTYLIINFLFYSYFNTNNTAPLINKTLIVYSDI